MNSDRMANDNSPVVARRTMLTGGAGLALGVAVTSSPLAAPVARAATTVRVSDLGFDAADSTPYLQAALDSTADIVIIDDVGADWITGPLHINRDDLSVVLEPGVTLMAKAGAFPSTSHCLITIDDQARISLVGYGATMKMNKPEYTSGEWRHVINLRSASEILVEGLTLRDSGGDGIYVGVSNVNPTAPRYCSDITVRNITATRNRRNALSVTSVDQMLIENSIFHASSGTSPQAGVDFEPNNAAALLTGIVMRDCRIDHNATYGLIVSIGKLDATSQPVDLLFDRITVGATSSQIPNLVYYGSGDSAPIGRVEFRDSLVRKSSVAGAVGVFAKASSGPELVFTRTVIWDYGNTVARWLPVTITAVRGTTTTVTGTYGGVAFTDCLLIADTTEDSITVDNEPVNTSGLADVTGNLAVVNPNGVTTDYGMNPTGVTIATPALASYPTTQVSVAAAAGSVTAGDTATLTFTRTSSDLQWPLSIAYTSSTGTAVPGVHFDIVSESIVFAPGAATTQLTIHTRDSEAITPVTLRIRIGGGRGYTGVTGSVIADITINP